ncbi:MAG: peptidoglycan-binding protein [Eubacteriales bacterium]|nr:peptidoglycan-binding protein [Eubacteriales bacterium]
MNHYPERMSDEKVRGFILVVLSLLLILIIFLIVRTFNAPKPVQATQAPPSVANPAANMPGGYPLGGALPSEAPTDVPTQVPTQTPEPTPRPTATPKPTEIITLRKGDNNENVRAMQERLIELSYLDQGSADGKFGSGTKSAVQEFQRNNGLAPDGAAGRETLTKLFSPDAR